MLLSWPNGELWAIEVKRSLAARAEKGFYVACSGLNPSRKFIVYPGTKCYRITSDIEVISPSVLVSAVR
ncbi:MAG: hypothetical protein OEV42_04905 [Deltaproteobacteria bacterium]|nr:hypothetical protein [Deltaproteobacteria bacterium]